MFDYSMTITITLLFFAFVILTLYLGIRVVPQSKVFIVERFGKYHKTLNGIHQALIKSWIFFL